MNTSMQLHLPHNKMWRPSQEHDNFLSELKCALLKPESPDSVMLSIAKDLLGFSGERLISFLHSILLDPHQLESLARRSYRHGNGFYKLVLESNKHFKLRLHIWLPGELGEENIHDHRWAFASTILCGQLESEIFAEALSDDARAYLEYLYYAQNSDHPAHIQRNGEVRLVCAKHSIRRAGDAYSMAPGVLHRIITTGAGMTATLMCQAAPARAWNRLIPVHEILPKVEQRYLESHELHDVLECFLDTWHRTDNRSYS